MDADQYDEFLQPLPDARREAIKRWLGGSLNECPVCGEPVRVMDSHRLIKAGIVHTACVPEDA